MNIIYGFLDQVIDRFNEPLFDEFQSVFNMMPICSLVNQKILVVHGGLTQFEDLTIDEIRRFLFTFSSTFFLNLSLEKKPQSGQKSTT